MATYSRNLAWKIPWMEEPGRYSPWGCKSWTQLSNFTLVMKLKVKESESEGHSVVSDSLRPHGLYSPWNSPGQNTGVGKLSLLQGIFATQGSNPGLMHCRQILYQLSHEGSPRTLEWVAFPFSRGSSEPRDQTQVSSIHCRWILYQLSHKGSPRILEWVAYPFSRGSS